MKKILKNKVVQISLLLITGVFIGWLIFKSDSTMDQGDLQEEAQETTYTCSMHPQIRQNEPGKCPICEMELIPVAQQSDEKISSPFVYKMSPEAIALANIQTQRVKAVSPEHELYLTGKVAVNEQTLEIITANYSGRIEKLFVDYTGQNIVKGQKLATIYSPELITAQKELIEASKFKEINPAFYDAAKKKLLLWKITESQIDKIEKREVVLTEFDVYSDQSGVVMRRAISGGDYVNKGNTLFEIADLSKLWVIFDAYESDLPFIRKGQKVHFTLTSIPGKEYVSPITFINPLINPQTRTASIRTEVSNNNLLLKPEMFVKGRVKANLPINEKSLVIPGTSLLWTGKRSIVYVKIAGSDTPAFQMREITLGAYLGDYYIVEDGLEEGEEIVTNGVFAVDAAAQLSGNYSMMNRPVDKRVTPPEEFNNQLTAFVNEYFNLKNNLVNSDSRKSNMSAKTLRNIFKDIDMSVLDKEQHDIWMQHHSALSKQLERLSRAANINEQRKILSPFSNELIEVLEKFVIKVEAVYIVFCPMAFDNEGAFWLSEFEEIKNPYFGDKMMRCGEIKQTVTPTGKHDVSKVNHHDMHHH